MSILHKKKPCTKNQALVGINNIKSFFRWHAINIDKSYGILHQTHYWKTTPNLKKRNVIDGDQNWTLILWCVKPTAVPQLYRTAAVHGVLFVDNVTKQTEQYQNQYWKHCKAQFKLIQTVTTFAAVSSLHHSVALKAVNFNEFQNGRTARRQWNRNVTFKRWLF